QGTVAELVRHCNDLFVRGALAQDDLMAVELIEGAENRQAFGNGQTRRGNGSGISIVLRKNFGARMNYRIEFGGGALLGCGGVSALILGECGNDKRSENKQNNSGDFLHRQ